MRHDKNHTGKARGEVAINRAGAAFLGLMGVTLASAATGQVFSSISGNIATTMAAVGKEYQTLYNDNIATDKIRDIFISNSHYASTGYEKIYVASSGMLHESFYADRTGQVYKPGALSEMFAGIPALTGGELGIYRVGVYPVDGNVVTGGTDSEWQRCVISVTQKTGWLSEPQGKMESYVSCKPVAFSDVRAMSFPSLPSMKL